MASIQLTYEARSERQLDQAATHLSNFMSVVGVAAFTAILTRGAGKKINVRAARARSVVKAASARDAGMTPKHFRAVLDVTMNRSAMKLFYRKIGRSTLDLKSGWISPKPLSRLTSVPFRNAGLVLLAPGPEAVCEPSCFGRNARTSVIDMARSFHPSSRCVDQFQTSGGVDFPDGVTACAIGGRNSQLLVATASNSLRAFLLPDLLSGSKSPETIDCPNAHAEGRVIQDVALAPKGNFMLSMTNDTEIKLFSFPAEGKPVETIKTTAKNHQVK